MAIPYFTLVDETSSARNQLTWMQTEEMKTYWHEAGHAVVARLTGFTVAWVSVDEAFIKADALAIQNHCNYGSGVCLTISSDRINPVLNRRSAMNKEAKETVIGYCMHVLAGPAVEERFDPVSFRPDASAGDYSQVAQILALTTRSNNALKKKLFDNARRSLRNMLNQNWELITRVSYELYTRGTLTGDELDEIIAESAMQAAA